MKRTIAAILAADVAGYSRLTAEDEDDTLERLADYSRVFRAEVAGVGGRIFNTAGDAILAEFPSAVEALRAAITIQEKLRVRNQDYLPNRKVQFRMGLNIGDVVETEWGDLLGDGVNVAARLEGIAEPGGICISRSVHDAIAAKLSVTFRDMGPQRLKNIPRPVHAFRVVLPSLADTKDESKTSRRLPRVLAFAGALAACLVLVAGLALWYRNAGDGPEENGQGQGKQASEPASGKEAGKRAEASVPKPDPAEQGDLLSASVAPPKRQCFADEVWMSGVLSPRREIEVGPDSEGLRIQKVLVSPNDDVASGQALAHLSTPEQPGVAVATVRAPVSGLVGRIDATVGALTSFKAQPLFRIIASGELELVAEAPIREIGRLAPGQPVKVKPLGMPEVGGRVRAVSRGIEHATQLGRARILMRTNTQLRQGTFARGVAKVGDRCGLSVPPSAIAHNDEGSVVFVSKDGRVEGRLVETGLSSRGAIEIRKGLDETDLVVTRAGPFVREGDQIAPIASAGGTTAN